MLQPHSACCTVQPHSANQLYDHYSVPFQNYACCYDLYRGKEKKESIFTTPASLHGDPRSITINANHNDFHGMGIFPRKQTL